MPVTIVPFKVCAMDQADSYQSLSVEAWLQSQAIPCGIFVDKVVLVPDFFLWVPKFSLVRIIPPVLQTHSFNYHEHYVILSVVRFVKYCINIHYNLTSLPPSVCKLSEMYFVWCNRNPPFLGNFRSIGHFPFLFSSHTELKFNIVKNTTLLVKTPHTSHEQQQINSPATSPHACLCVAITVFVATVKCF